MHHTYRIVRHTVCYKYCTFHIYTGTYDTTYAVGAGAGQLYSYTHGVATCVSSHCYPSVSGRPTYMGTNESDLQRQQSPKDVPWMRPVAMPTHCCLQVQHLWLTLRLRDCDLKHVLLVVGPSVQLLHNRDPLHGETAHVLHTLGGRRVTVRMRE